MKVLSTFFVGMIKLAVRCLNAEAVVYDVETNEVANWSRKYIKLQFQNFLASN